MRITKLLLEPEEIIEIEALTDEVTSANKDITLAYDFAKDAYALFSERINKRRTIKSFWDIFNDIRNQYTKFHMMDLMKNVDFYGRVRNFFRYFLTSRLFHELDKLDPLEALKIFLNTFQPPQEKQDQEQTPQPKPQPNDSDDDKDDDDKENKEDDEDEDKNDKSQQQDQGGRSADEDNLPIDMTQFKQQLPKIEKVLDSGLLDKEDFQNYLGQQAGIGHNEFKVGNIVDLIDKISKRLSDKELEIFYVARKKEATELYRRDEILESVPYPDDEMTIKTLDSPMEILKLIPTQYAYDDDIFIQKLVKHELLVRDYQARRLKRQALYLLIDISGSMSGGKNIYACGVALAFVRQAVTEGSTYFLRFFDDSPHDLYTVTTKEEAEKMSNILIREPFSGGGTSIQSAIRTAVDDITRSPEKFEKAEIMV
ncbi:MAG: VWA domain-containing protein, partial [Candidatus Pacearchaeota archaeon]